MKTRIFLYAAFALSFVASLGDWEDESFDSLPAELRAKMPNQDDPDTRAALRCSVCHWCVVELHSALLRINDTFVKQHPKHKGGQPLKRPSQDSIDDIFDDFCTALLPEYGLHVDEETQRIKPKYTKLASKIQGAWVARIFENECSAFVAKFTPRAVLPLEFAQPACELETMTNTDWLDCTHS